MKRLLSICLLILLYSSVISKVRAQQMGAFEKTITFMSSPRTLSLFVPFDYDSTQKYQLMVGLHGLGDNSQNYRNALIVPLDWENHFPKTIFVCPDGGSDQNGDFFVPAGDEEVIKAAMDYAMQNYHIDTARVILQGFSLGGRSALKYGLDHPQMFFGLLLNTPALQGILDAENHPLASLNYAYGNASQIPVFIVNGGDDFFYLAPIERAFEKLVMSNGMVQHTVVPNLGHAISDFSYLQGVIKFFEDPATAPYDMDLIKIDVPERTCSSPILSKVLVRNTGSQELTSAELNYTVNGTSHSYTWSGNLGLYEHTWVGLPSINASVGDHSLDVGIGLLNASITDTLNARNNISGSFIVAGQGASLSFFEGFESPDFPPVGWVRNNTGSAFYWDVDNEVKRDGKNSMLAFNTILIFYTKGISEELMSPLLNLTGVSSPELRFDVAYNYHKYTPPYFTVETSFADTLEVSISTDCGNRYTLLYKKGGEELKTFPQPILNPLSLQACFINPGKDNWRTEIIDLSAYGSFSEAIIKFSYVSAMGGCINIDNISVDQLNSIEKKKSLQSFELYPNPAMEYVGVRVGEDIDAITIYDISGRSVLTRQIEGNPFQEISINTQDLPAGVYVIEVSGTKRRASQKLIIAW